ncbi:hypothetical protein ONE63_007351 [Megalurothrips usitatus]|uniref:Uncharacterized protein n=1 Tax=Megalurothrips usitatus TaxID=439358 RepID=A0AAV7XV31_9NEOP|nr:hypothetical protein ONE63_007351 [Megalurothrips usitatus]
MAASGRFPSFDPNGSKKWTTYYQRFLFHCQTRKLTTDADKKAELMSISSDVMFEFVQAVCRREVCDELLTFTAICEPIENHLCPKPSEILAAAKFHTRQQRASESVTEFVTELRRLARPANFGGSSDRMIRDRLVIGLANPDAKALLFRIHDLTLDKAIESVEAAAGNVAASNETIGAVNFVGRTQGQRQGQGSSQGQPRTQGQPAGSPAAKPCFRCAGTNHTPENCRYIEYSCNACKCKGHLERACPVRLHADQGGQSQQQQQKKSKKKPKQRGGVYNATANGEPGPQSPQPPPSESPPQQPPPQPLQGQVLANNCYTQQNFQSEYSMYALSAVKSETVATLATGEHANPGEPAMPPPNFVHIQLSKGTTERFQIDNGCPMSLVSETTLRRVWPHAPPLYRSTLGLSQWTQVPVNVKGYLLVKLTAHTREYVLPLYVCEGPGRALLGRQWFEQFGIKVEMERKTVSCEVQSEQEMHAVEPNLPPNVKD